VSYSNGILMVLSIVLCGYANRHNTNNYNDNNNIVHFQDVVPINELVHYYTIYTHKPQMPANNLTTA
jgi:hypothetical protein